MSDNALILIIGAGPVCLSAARELTRAGGQVRIQDENGQCSTYAKAMGINSHTLELLEPSGVTPRLLEQGVRIPGVQFGQPGKKTLSNRLFAQRALFLGYQDHLLNREATRIFLT
jgi:2-polyprenyl-6-methoxyphenol hydroxylase-like FAD-dependent oxidoreductase